MQHSTPTMQELVDYQTNKPATQNATQDKLDKIDALVRRYATWDSILTDILNADGQRNPNGTTMDDCFVMKMDIMGQIKELAIN